MPRPVSTTSIRSSAAFFPASDKHAARLRKADRVPDEIAEDTLQQCAICRNRFIRSYEREPQALLLGLVTELDLESFEKLRELERCDAGLNPAGVELADLQERTKEIFHDGCRHAHSVKQLGPQFLVLFADAAINKDLQRGERLTQIVVRGPEKTRLCFVRLFRGLLRFAQLSLIALYSRDIGEGDGHTPEERRPLRHMYDVARCELIVGFLGDTEISDCVARPLFPVARNYPLARVRDRRSILVVSHAKRNRQVAVPAEAFVYVDEQTVC